MTTTGPVAIEELDSPSDVLVFARWCRGEADRFEANVLMAAVTWAEQHPPESIDEAVTWMSPAGDTGLLLAGPGAPLVTEFCIAEFAAAIGRSTDSGRAVIAAGVELKYRLPRTWARVVCGDLQVWRARRIADATLLLSPEAAAFVDTQVAAFAHRIGIAALERLVAEAIARFMPDTARENAEKASDGRQVTFHHDQVTFDGTTFVEGELDLADALDLDAALAQGAEQLKLCGSQESLDVRRSMAAGEIARHQLALDLAADTDTTTDPVARAGAATDEGRAAATPPGRPAPKPRQVVLHVHLSYAAITGTSTGLDLARVENQRQVVTADQVRIWCANPDTTVVVKPIIDLSEHIHVEAYEVPDRLRDQTTERDHSCVFPWCTRPARRCDCDHVIAYDRDGTTCSCNVAPLCRRHHRLKTHSAWTHTVLEPGTYLWSSPHGYQFLRDHHGTTDVSRDVSRKRRPPDQPRPTDPQHFY